MSKTSELFEIRNVEWRYIQSTEMGSDRRRKAGIASAEVECKSCGKEWRSEEGRQLGDLENLNGSAIRIQCPECKKSEAIFTNGLG